MIEDERRDPSAEQGDEELREGRERLGIEYLNLGATELSPIHEERSRALMAQVRCFSAQPKDI
jgi:hypothetical protein